MANKQTKYTHITARCSQLLKALCYVTLERCTGDTLSTAYWRLREGKGLLSYKDKQTLEALSEQITLIRRYCHNPSRLSNEEHQQLTDMRDELLARMESYRDWLYLGSKPAYLTNMTHHDYSDITLELSLSRINPEIIKATLEDQKKFWRSLEFSSLLECDQHIWHDTKGVLENNPKHKALDRIYDDLQLQMLPTDKVWQIRTDMEHRSSARARINSTMYWMVDVPSKSEGHEAILEQNKILIENFIQWVIATKEQVSNKVRITDDVLGIMESFINSIRIPEFAQGEEDLKIGGE